MNLRTTVSSFSLFAVAACSAGSETSPLTPYDAGSGAANDAGSIVADAATPPAGGDGGGAPTTTGVVVNEVMLGPDWIELKNVGTSIVDVSGWSLADTENGAGTGPKTTEQLVFPASTKLGPGGYLLVRAGQTLDAGITDTACLDGGVPFCFVASFGLSRSKGDGVFLLKADKSVVDKTEWGANTVPTGSAWARLPDGTGAFALTTTPTPAAANR